MPPALSFSPSRRVALVTCAGELDVANAGPLRRAVTQAVDSTASVVAVDLSAVTFVDSTVLGVLVEAQHALVPARRLVVAGAAGLPLRALQITGLDTVLEVLQTAGALDRVDLDAVLR